MPTVKFSLNEEYYQQLVDGANEKGISIQDYIRNKLFDISTIFIPVEALNRALRKYSSGETFTLPQLYANDWTIKQGFAGVFGKKFFKFVEAECSEKIKFDKMVESGSIAQYVMI